MSKLLGILKGEFLELLPPTIFFLIAFNIILLTDSLMLKQYGIDGWALSKAAIGALIAGKAVLIADKLPLIDRFPDKPLIYNIVWKTIVYVTAALLFRYIEHVVEFMWNGGGFVAANADLWSAAVWPRFMATHIWLFVLFLAYCTLRELVRVMGREQVLQLFFGKPARQK
jgi:hypothetical protein